MSFSFVFGRSSLNLPIIGYKFGSKGANVLILGGVHGNEPEGIACAFGLYNLFSEAFPYRLQLTLIPVFNPDGALKLERRNGSNVDLNRNLPTNDWTSKYSEEKYFPGLNPSSEPETKSIVDFIKNNKLALIISLHSWHPLLNINGNCREEAEVISKITGYEIKEDIGYPTPGSLGTYAGLERDIPTLTYEIERGLEVKKIVPFHCKAIIESLKITEKKSN